MNGTSTNSSLVGNQFSNNSQTVFKQKSSLLSRTGSKNNSKTDKTTSRNYLNQLSSNDSMQNSITSQGIGSTSQGISNSLKRSNRSNFSKASSKKRSMSKKKHTKLSQVDILNDTGFALGMNIDMVEEEGSVDLDESELFLDGNESMVNLGDIVGGSNQRNIIMES